MQVFAKNGTTIFVMHHGIALILSCVLNRWAGTIRSWRACILAFLRGCMGNVPDKLVFYFQRTVVRDFCLSISRFIFQAKSGSLRKKFEIGNFRQRYRGELCCPVEIWNIRKYDGILLDTRGMEMSWNVSF